MTARDEVRELRATIQAITGKPPRTGCSLTYLRRRVAMLVPEQTVDGHELVRQLGGGPGNWSGPQAMSRSLIDVVGATRAMMLTEIAKIKGQTAIDLTMRAVDEYAVKHGFGTFVERAKKDRR